MRNGSIASTIEVFLKAFPDWLMHNFFPQKTAYYLFTQRIDSSVSHYHRHARYITSRRGLPGPAIQPLALAAVAAVCEAVHIPVIGVGGIVDAASARDFLIVGASAVQVGTATFVNPETALQVLDGLRGGLTTD